MDEDLKLRISLELYLKRLIVGGLEKVYEIVMHRLRSDKAEQNDVERKRAIRLSVWKKFGKEEIDTGDFSDLWIRLDSVNKVLPPDFCKRHGGRSPYIE